MSEMARQPGPCCGALEGDFHRPGCPELARIQAECPHRAARDNGGGALECTSCGLQMLRADWVRTRSLRDVRTSLQGERATAFETHLRVMEEGHALIGEEMRQYFTDDEE